MSAFSRYGVYLKTAQNDYDQNVSTAIHILGDTFDFIISPLQNVDTVTKTVPHTSDHHLIAVNLDNLQSEK